MDYRIYVFNEKGVIDDNVIHVANGFLKSRRKVSYWYNTESEDKLDKIFTQDSVDDFYIHIKKQNDYEALQLFDDFYEYLVNNSPYRYIIRLENGIGDVLSNKIILNKTKNTKCCVII